MTPVIDTKTEKINDRSTFDRGNSMLKLIKTRNFLKAEQSICYLTSEKDSKYIHRKLKKHDEIKDVCESLKKFKNTKEVQKFYKKATEMN